MKFTLKSILGGLGGFFAGLHPVFYTLLVLMLLDIATGFLAGYITRKLNSDVSWRGMAKKAMMLLVVAAASIMAQAWEFDVPLGAIVAGFYCIHELLSISENAIRAGLPLPKQFVDAIEKIQER